MTSIKTDTAVPDDAKAAVRVLRESIRVLCHADHRNDENTLELWLRNKTEENFLRWLSTPELTLVVARVDGHVRGVGSVHATGVVRLCYVEPGFERSGVGGAVLRALEAAALSRGVRQLRLNSSLTAQGFYERHGYVRYADPVPGFGVTKGYPYLKRLAR
jgi:GNAT superfamily N-acetyltransferase